MAEMEAERNRVAAGGEDNADGISGKPRVADAWRRGGHSGSAKILPI